MANILVVDDAAFMRRLLKDRLSKLGHNVVGESEDGEQAILAYRRLKPDLVTMDLTMPKMDGIEAVRRIKRIDPNAKIIICSAMGQTPMVIESIKAGAKDFIVKPFQSETLKDIIDKVL